MKLRSSKIFLITCIVSSFLFVSSSCTKKCSICKAGKIEYDTIFLGKPDSCNLIVLKRKKAGFDSTKSPLWPKSDADRTEPIELDTAIKYIKNYNEFYNPQLKQTTFIDFDIAKLIEYMSNTVMAGHCDTLRIYMGTDSSKRNDLILVGKNAQGDYYSDQYRPINYGGLCPPPDKTCITNRAAKLLILAIRDSRDNRPTELGRTQIVELKK